MPLPRSKVAPGGELLEGISFHSSSMPGLAIRCGKKRSCSTNAPSQLAFAHSLHHKTSRAPNKSGIYTIESIAARVTVFWKPAGPSQVKASSFTCRRSTIINGNSISRRHKRAPKFTYHKQRRRREWCCCCMCFSSHCASLSGAINKLTRCYFVSARRI